jgi:hypothetical protein
MNRPVISFSVDDNQYKGICEYAKTKGFDKPSNLARMALFRYIARNKTATPKRSTAVKSGEGLEYFQSGENDDI